MIFIFSKLFVLLHGFLSTKSSMSKFGQYNIPLKNIVDETRIYDFDLNNEYFAKIDSPEVSRGHLGARVTVLKKNEVFELRFEIQGVIFIQCNRCLDDMEQPIKHTDIIQVKLGTTYSEENETVIVPESDGAINVAWFMYEFIVLSIPIKHVHAPGECNKMVMTKLKRHIARQKDDTEENPLFDDDGDDTISDEPQTDPRWDGLQNINFDN